MNTREIWMPVKDYVNYEVSNWGRVRSLNYHREGKIKVLKLIKQNNGYLYIGLCKNGEKKQFRVHRLIYEAFNGPIPDGYELDHLDGCKTNNKLENLRCVNHEDNVHNPVTSSRHLEAIKKLVQDQEWRNKTAEAVRNARNKTILQINNATGDVIRRWECEYDVFRENGIQQQNISACCRGKRKSAGGYKWRFFMPPACIS